ncbi:MAG: flagellar basal body rod protein FlgB [Candidatus Sericytochromatia bacterium]
MTYTPEVTLSQKVLDLTTTRHQLIANNIANANTPNYKKTDLSFSETLELMAERTKSVEVNTPSDLFDGSVVAADLSRGKKLTYLNAESNGDLGIDFARGDLGFEYQWFKMGSEMSGSTRVKNPTKAEVISETEPIIIDTSNSERLDGNNVNVDLEVSEMIKNTSYYNMLTSIVSGDFRIYRTIISAR